MKIKVKSIVNDLDTYHMYSHYLFARAYDYLVLVVDGYEVWFVW